MSQLVNALDLAWEQPTRNSTGPLTWLDLSPTNDPYGTLVEDDSFSTDSYETETEVIDPCQDEPNDTKDEKEPSNDTKVTDTKGGNDTKVTDTKVCRLCLEEVDVAKDRDKIISPCACDGSMKYIHIACFNQQKTDVCPTCHFKVKVLNSTLVQQLVAGKDELAGLLSRFEDVLKAIDAPEYEAPRPFQFRPVRLPRFQAADFVQGQPNFVQNLDDLQGGFDQPIEFDQPADLQQLFGQANNGPNAQEFFPNVPVRQAHPVDIWATIIPLAPIELYGIPFRQCIQTAINDVRRSWFTNSKIVDLYVIIKMLGEFSRYFTLYQVFQYLGFLIIATTSYSLITVRETVRRVKERVWGAPPPAPGVLREFVQAEMMANQL